MCSYYGTEAPILAKSGNPVASVRVKPASSHHGRLENETTQFLGFEGVTSTIDRVGISVLARDVIRH